MTRKIIDCFPITEHIRKPHPSQVSVINAIEKAFTEGYKNVLLEAPVGSGKSAIAMTCATYYGSSHILTPRKSLQDQYLDDFDNHGVVLMKGRNAYPCTYPSIDKAAHYENVVSLIRNGQPIRVPFGQVSCAEGPCKGNTVEYRKCTGGGGEAEGGPDYPCPYNVAIETAQGSGAVIHNLHSFIFQANFANRFEERELMIIDECHDVESTVRGFAEKTILLKGIVPNAEIPLVDLKTLDHWVDWFREFATRYRENQRVDGGSDRQDFYLSLVPLADLSDKFGEKFTVGIEQNTVGQTTRFTFTPAQVGHLINQYLLSYGKKRLLMSGTIYSKTMFCKKNGLNEEETCFIRIGSSFPLASRPIIFKNQYKVDTSHKMWDENFKEMIEKIETIMDVFDDAKGLIHTPSYMASQTILAALRGTGRVMTHNKDDFQSQLAKFYETEEPKVFLSPICQQGVDFKYDRARFQIALRVPYLNTSDSFVGYQVKNDYPWYNHQALVNFGQIIGRVNRAPDDYGVTILMDERFGKFLSKNKSVLPKWLNDAIQYK